MQSAVKKRSVVVSGHRTSISLERIFWDCLRDIAAQRGLTINQLVSEIDAGRSGNLSSAIRVYVLGWAMEGRFLRAGAPDAAHPPQTAASGQDLT
ncbi:ribbon-helix-helix domain-containing protein [Marinibaculum pumilum]|uniref:Ribbon-helix-helix domain-containing protein n=1 Tax=Marinibaculum pumilum TaxID=1766165 RepID=A0ABV7KZR9_9PROT